MQPVPCVVLAACAAVASAQVTLLSENRVFDLSAQGESDFGGDQQTFLDFGSSANDDPFVPWVVGDSVFTNGAQSAVASASGAFVMDIDPDGFFSSGSLSASATILDETGYNASASGSALMEVVFTLAAASEWRLTLDGSGSMLAELAASGGGAVFSFSTGGVDQAYLLGPGEYTLRFASSVVADTFVVGQFQGASAMGAAFVLVPAPGVLGLLGVGLAWGVRRRR